MPLLGLDFSPLAESIASHRGTRMDMDALDHPNLHLLVGRWSWDGPAWACRAEFGWGGVPQLALPVVARGSGGKPCRPQGLRLVGSPSVQAALALLELQLPAYTQST